MEEFHCIQRCPHLRVLEERRSTVLSRYVGYKCSFDGCEVECPTWTAMRRHVATHRNGQIII